MIECVIMFTRMVECSIMFSYVALRACTAYFQHDWSVICQFHVSHDWTSECKSSWRCHEALVRSEVAQFNFGWFEYLNLNDTFMLHSATIDNSTIEAFICNQCSANFKCILDFFTNSMAVLEDTNIFLTYNNVRFISRSYL